MASIFTYDPDPPRVSSPWSISGSSTPHLPGGGGGGETLRNSTAEIGLQTIESNRLADYGISKLEPEPQEGPTEYKLHLLLRSRRPFISMSTGQVVGGNYHFGAAISKPSSSTALSLNANGGGTATSADTVTLASPKSPSPTVTPPVSKLLSRQQRLQQLTTQLLWRLQQSSPFHSSSTANLILPVLPEATPKLGLPQKASRLLPGLEESQGALYEIGVADDGTFVGLIKDELDESLNNLKAMAASLGCKVEVLRKVVVGACEWTENNDPADTTAKVHSEELWVAEALVSPDLDYYNHQSIKDLDLENLSLNDNGVPAIKEEANLDGSCSHTEQIRISLTGPSAAGKSSLLGTLTTSALDNGRGKSRLSLLKHRHEISSGITSSVAQELIGYRDLPSSFPSSSATTEGSIDVVNYASGNVTAWNDIHAASDGGRLAFVSDLPGLPRYVKSTLRGLVSWAPHYVFLCIPANSSHDTATAQDDGDQAPEIDICLAYLDLCIRLETPLIVAITKLDRASRIGLKQTLARVLSTMKAADKKPLMLAVAGEDPGRNLNIHKVSAADCQEALKIVNAVNGDWSSTIPILLTSAVNGSGIGKFHALLRYLPLPQTPTLRQVLQQPRLRRSQKIPTDVFDIDEVFAIPPSKVYSSFDTSSDTKGVVLCGVVRHGSISVGDELVIGPIAVETKPEDVNTPQASRPRSLQGSENALNPRSFKSRTPSGELSPFSQASSPGKSRFLSHAEWQRVRVVSVRNLRLSVRILLEDQVGTIGVEPIPWGPGKEVNALGRLRKGMILAQAKISPKHPAENTSIPSCLASSTAFVATFPARDFSSPGSPPLILGGVVVVYIGNIRAAAKVTCVALADDTEDDSPVGPLLDEPDFFNFDDDDDKEKQKPNKDNKPRRARPESEKTINVSSAHVNGYVNITFGFISSIEWVEVGSLVVVMPGISTTTSATGDPIALSGLEGYVGRLVEVSSSEDMSER